jgi:hypothetical protein
MKEGWNKGGREREGEGGGGGGGEGRGILCRYQNSKERSLRNRTC